MSTLSFTEIQKYDWRTELFLRKFENGEPFELVDGTSVVLSHPNPELENFIRTDTPPPRGYDIPTVDGGKTRFAKLKKSKEFGGGISGSGAGAANTKTSESAQCVYCQALWDNPDTEFGEDEIKSAYGKVKVNATLQDILNMAEDWKMSSVIAAKLLYRGLKKKKYDWYRGTGFQDKIEKVFKQANIAAGRPFANVNKWTPADIWAVAVDTESKYVFDGFRPLELINNELLRAYDNREILGISLKKVKEKAAVEQVNYKRKFTAPVFKGITLGKRDYWKSKDGYIFYEGGEIQFRTFPTFQCEIIGVVAKHGKISGGDGPKSVMGKIMKRVGAEPHEAQREVAATHKKNPKVFFDRWHKKYLEAGFKSVARKGFEKLASGRDANWCVSKYLVTTVMNNIRGKEQEFLTEILKYAKSQSSDSAVHLKVKAK